MAMKSGARHSASDQQHLNAAMSNLVDAGAQPPQPPQSAMAQRIAEAQDEYAAMNGKPGKSISDKIHADENDDSRSTIVAFGSALKSMGNGHYGGDLVVFTDADHTDLTGQYFDATTDFGLPKDGTPLKCAVYFNHCQPLPTKSGGVVLIKDQIGDAELSLKQDGIFADMVLYNQKRYESYLAAMGLSSATAEHLIEVKKVGNAEHIERWPLGLDCSITPTPAESRTRGIVPLKSLTDAQALQDSQKAVGDTATAIDATGTEASLNSVGVNNMPEVQTAAPDATAQAAQFQEMKALMDSMKSFMSIQGAVASGGVKASSAGVDVSNPKGAAGIEVKDVLKTAYKSIEFDKRTGKLIPTGGFGDFLQDVRNADRKSNPFISDRLRIMQDERLKAIKATGANETVASEGGWLVQVDHENEFLRLQYESAVLSSRTSRRTLGPGVNGTTVYGRDETSRVDASRWGGVLGYHIGEAGTITATKPKFRRIELKLKKVAAAVYATDELLQDTNLLEQEVMDSAPREIAFQVDNDVFRGAGSDAALGFMNSPSLISVSAENGQAATTLVLANIQKMWMHRWGPNSMNYIWTINQDVEQQLYSLSLSIGVAGQSTAPPAHPGKAYAHHHPHPASPASRPAPEPQTNPA